VSGSVVRLLRAAPHPLALARALGDRPGLAVLASCPAGAPRSEDARWSFVASDPVESSDDLVPPAGEGDAGGPAPRWIGVVPYEALRAGERPDWTRAPDDRPSSPLASAAWRRYAAVARVDHATGEVAVVGDDEASVSTMVRRLSSGSSRGDAYSLRVLRSGESPEAHVARVRAALALIAQGDLYEVNLARRIPLEVRGDALALFTSLLEAAPAPWSFLQVLDSGDRCNVVCGTSPELALSVRGRALRTCPVKGTRPRGRNAVEDAAAALALDEDPKERAELTMAVDVHRNDLGRVAVPGTVHVPFGPRVVAGRTVWSRMAEVLAMRAPGVPLEDVARAVLPCGSITGAPKVRAMEVIARLEPHRRGAYTGVFGWVGRGPQQGGREHGGRDGHDERDGCERLELAMAIRTLRWDAASGEGEYFAGGGIVADSVPERELDETGWKATQLRALEVGGAADSR
jgi:anthranilate/para-aminobenzoate synthase component I